MRFISVETLADLAREISLVGASPRLTLTVGGGKAKFYVCRLNGSAVGFGETVREAVEACFVDYQEKRHAADNG